MKRGAPPRRRTPLRSRTRLERRTRIRPYNPERRRRIQAVTDGPQAALCRRSPCAACRRRPTKERPTDPHHWPSRARGGTDRDTCPLCRRCHDLFHQLGEERFRERTGVDVRAVAAELASRIEAKEGPWAASAR